MTVTELSPDFTFITAYIKDFPIAQVFKRDQYAVAHSELHDANRKAQESFKKQIVSENGKMILLFSESRDWKQFIDVWESN
ncbi:hypothetical protein D3C72_2136230 [compost metagenome]